MKTPDDVVARIQRRLTNKWAAALAAEIHLNADAGEDTVWPQTISLGRTSSTDLAQDFARIIKEITTWRQWARDHHVDLREESRRVAGTEQHIPTHVHIPEIDTAAAVADDGWPAKLQLGRVRIRILHERFPELERPERMLAATIGLSDTDFALLLDAADWFAESTPEQRAQLTPRQVPVEGLHAKWLNTRRTLVAELAGLEDLGLLPPHPARIHFTYLDPDHLAAGGRRHDSASVGDNHHLPYRPTVVLISENKDTAVGFPPVPGGIAVEGGGRGAATHAMFDWLRNAPVIAYWGDMDADGLEILNEFRAAGIDASSLLMDLPTYEKWERFGTNTDARGKPLRARPPRPVVHLTQTEAELYRALTSHGWARCRRIEQERIPLAVAHADLLALTVDGDGRTARKATV